MENGNSEHQTRSETPDALVEEAVAPPNPRPSPVPDGGFLAWVQCAAVFCMFVNTLGLLNSFGMSFSQVYIFRADH